ncbi:MAG: preprotein translocase subunit YajC [candidate division Zixibacteria bacterium RBG_16_50_21]|nr:MAG: preprotein translocase subunit YajC [candidate division Zixibacteria bacterium RBG_16_50_21]
MGGQPGQSGGAGAGIMGFLPFLLIIVIIYFLMLRPQMKKQKHHQKMLTELKKGDRVVTNGGMLGTIVGINEKENVVVLKVGEDTKIEFLKSSIAGPVKTSSE